MPRVHVFVCDNHRPEGGRPACGDRGGRAFAQALTEAVLARGAGGRIAITRCQCLGLCFDGPTAVEYPAGRWWTGLTPEIAGDLVTALDAGPDAPLPPALAERLALIDD
ncbi:MAG: (2Fe-2S) ferredoxin domain-containing protein [Myxococcales bacterium]|nr:(2Fe-2S) ferredoxin domain-containing protein [Myxococcales bacterium]